MNQPKNVLFFIYFKQNKNPFGSMFRKKKFKINQHLFYETSHSPALVDIVGMKMLAKVVDFCFIANPYYPNKRLLKKIQQYLPTVIKAYPSSNPILSQQHLASVLHVKPEHLIIGNGATELITIIERDLIDNLAIPVPTFSEYTEKLRKKDSAVLYQLPANDSYQLNLDHYAEWIDKNHVSSALIINPGNPTGQLLPLEKMKSFLKKMNHLKMVIVDESFIDFAGVKIPSLMPHIQEYQNLLIVRSMSKHCGVPGLRLGYCCTSNPEFLKQLRQLLPVWNINTLAEYFLTQLDKTDKEYHVARLKVIKDINYLYEKLRKIEAFYIYPSSSNFLLIKSNCGIDATTLQEILLEQYLVYVRDCSNKVGLDNYHIRVASQGKKKDKKLIKALNEISEKCRG